ncbi:hypothetical protein WH52_12665 [Tenacibaculum holothuriorum]|uniref:Lipoprotein n=1 Tax=Tenacibaculum holothuriorum TaxID=1635173 RepID=A0A1Y2P9J4_9FLAO|nr:hypothetical protein [Tenacibaculum holothuriorum]OSY87116.1 hypothetical protein WH52_12665 [Tenacibaculum holothuriorum]
MYKLFINTITLCFFVVVFSSCRKEKSLCDDKTVILLSSDYKNTPYENSGYKGWIPSQRDFKLYDEILKKELEKSNFSFLKRPRNKYLRNYYKQILPFINNQGDRILHVNAFCKILDSPDEVMFSWKENYMSVNDGGECYWKININLDKKKSSDFKINGMP